MRFSKKKAAEFLAESSRIEGYEIPCSEYLAALRGGVRAESQHVQNSVMAIGYVLDHLSEPLTEEHVLSLHGLQMAGLLPSVDAGRYRRANVRVGSAPCPPHDEIPTLMAGFVHRFNEAAGRDPKACETSCLWRHYDFEVIHPFIDGNGRTGRLLWLWDLLRLGGKIHPILDHYGPRPAPLSSIDMLLDLESAMVTDFVRRRGAYYAAIRARRREARECAEFGQGTMEAGGDKT